jgi:large conductance mechanosensitive channel
MLGATVVRRSCVGRQEVRIMLKGFREFVLRGNVIDLAVAVVIGAAFTLVVNAVVQWLITPLIAAIFGKPNLDDVMTFTINGAEFSIGGVLTALINFLLVAIAVYFVLIVPMNRLREMRASGQEEPEAPAEDILLLQEIRDLLRDRRPLGP